MKQRLLGIVVALVIIGVFAWYITAHWQQFAELSLVHPWLLVLAAVFVAVNLYVLGTTAALALRPLGVRLGFHETFGLATLVRFSKYIAPGYVSTAVRAIYLKRTYRLAYAKYASSFVVSSLIRFVLGALIGIAAFLWYGGIVTGSLVPTVILVLAAVAAFIAALVVPLGAPQRWLARSREKHNNKVLGRLAAALDGFVTIRARPRLFLGMVGLSFAAVITTALIMMALYGVLGYGIGFVQVLFLAAVVSWAVLLSITPANIGIREGLMVLAAQLVGVPVAETLAVSILQRLVVLIVVTITASYYAPRLLGTSLANIGSIKQTSRSSKA